MRLAGRRARHHYRAPRILRKIDVACRLRGDRSRNRRYHWLRLDRMHQKDEISDACTEVTHRPWFWLEDKEEDEEP